MSTETTERTKDRIVAGFSEVPPADREQYIRDNAESMLRARDRIIDRQREVLRALNDRIAGYKSTIDKQAEAVGALQRYVDDLARQVARLKRVCPACMRGPV